MWRVRECLPACRWRVGHKSYAENPAPTSATPGWAQLEAFDSNSWSIQHVRKVESLNVASATASRIDKGLLLISDLQGDFCLTDTPFMNRDFCIALPLRDIELRALVTLDPSHPIERIL